MKPRHPNRFHVERQQAEEFNRWRDKQGNPPAKDSPVVRATIEPMRMPLLQLVVTDEMTQQAQQQIEQILGAPRKRAPWELRQRFPGGWVNAPYVNCERLSRLRAGE